MMSLCVCCCWCHEYNTAWHSNALPWILQEGSWFQGIGNAVLADNYIWSDCNQAEFPPPILSWSKKFELCHTNWLAWANYVLLVTLRIMQVQAWYKIVKRHYSEDLESVLDTMQCLLWLIHGSGSPHFGRLVIQLARLKLQLHQL